MTTLNRPVTKQAMPAAGALADLHRAGVATEVNTMKVCNQSDEAAKFRISVAINGAVDARLQYLYYDIPIDANDTYSITEGWVLGNADVLRVRSDTGQCSFTAFMDELR